MPGEANLQRNINLNLERWVTTGARAKKRKFWIAMQLLNDPDDNFPSEEENDNLFLPFNYAQVECNHIYRAMIHHIICSAVVPTDTIVDVFEDYKILCLIPYINFYYCRFPESSSFSPCLIPYINFYYCR